METETSRAACHDDDFPFEGEDGGEVLELCFCHCGLRLGLELGLCFSDGENNLEECFTFHV